MKHHLLLLFLLVLAASVAAGGNPAPAAAAEFVRRSCRSTRYPRVCEQSLMGYAPSVGRSPRRLAQAALTVGADRARACSGYLAGLASPRPPGPIKDCLDVMRDGEDRLRQSAREMDRMGRARSPRFAWRLSNVQTWASAALTDASTCLDSLGRAAGAAPLRKRVVAMSQATSNALALVNQLGPRR